MQMAGPGVECAFHASAAGSVGDGLSGRVPLGLAHTCLLPSLQQFPRTYWTVISLSCRVFRAINELSGVPVTWVADRLLSSVRGIQLEGTVSSLTTDRILDHATRLAGLSIGQDVSIRNSGIELQHVMATPQRALMPV
jgi:hypothetical protein